MTSADTADVRLIQMRNALRRLAIVAHVRPTYGGGEVPNGGSCKLCKSEWSETSTEFHRDDCLLADADDGPADTALERRITEPMVRAAQRRMEELTKFRATSEEIVLILRAALNAHIAEHREVKS